MNARKLAAFAATLALTTGLIGAGVSASYSDNGSAIQNISVGTFGCSVTSTDSHAVVSGNSVTVNLPDIGASTSGNYQFDVTVNNTGSIPAVVTWAAATSGTIMFQPAGRMGYAMGTSGDPMNVPLSLAGGASHTYASGIGFMWAELTSDDLGKSATVTYTANCANTPAPPPPTSHVAFVGVSSVTNAANGLQAVATASNGVNVATFQGAGTFVTGNLNGNGKILFAATGPYALLVQTSTGSALITCTTRVTTTFSGCTTTSGTGTLATGYSVEIAPMSLSLPAGWNVGDLAVALTAGDGVPSGFTQKNATVQSTTKLSTHPLVAGDSSFAYSVARGSSAGIAVYRGASAVGANTYGTINQMVPLVCRGLTAANGAPMVKTDGSSWVGCFAHDAAFNGPTNVGAMGFPGTTARTASGGQIGLSDTNAPVAAWANSSWQGNWPASHSAEAYSFELLSQ